jgi:hypothetical protein
MSWCSVLGVVEVALGTLESDTAPNNGALSHKGARVKAVDGGARESHSKVMVGMVAVVKT